MSHLIDGQGEPEWKPLKGPMPSSEERVVMAVVSLMVAPPRDTGFAGLRGSGCAGEAEWLIKPRKAETDDEYTERLTSVGLASLRGGE